MDSMFEVLKAFGQTGLVTWCAYKLLDKWAAAFLAVHDRQATAITELATAVKESHGSQQEVLTGVRVLSQKVEDVIGYLREREGDKPVR